MDASQDLAAAEGTPGPLDLAHLFPSLKHADPSSSPAATKRRHLAAADDVEGGGNGNNATDVNTECEVCQLGATVAATGRLPSCYRYHASPGFNELIR